MRIDPRVLDEIRRWASDEMRSVNGQVEYLLRQSLNQANRLPKNDEGTKSAGKAGDSSDRDSGDSK